MNEFLCVAMSSFRLFALSAVVTNTLSKFQFCRGAPKKFLHRRAALHSKIFVDRENNHAYGILRKRAIENMCPKFEYKLKMDESHNGMAESFSPANAVEALQVAVESCRHTGTSISDEKFDYVVDSFTDVCERLNTDQLIRSLQLLQLLPAVEGVNSRNFLELWKALDDACSLQIQNWSVDEILRCSDLWYKLNLTKVCEFVWEGIRKIGRKARKLTPTQFTHTIFLCNLLRRPLVDMFEIELRFERIFADLSVDEVGIICAGFFKTQTKIHSQTLVEKIYRLLIKHLDEVDDITLVNFLKTLRYSSKLPQVPLMTELLEKLCEKIPHISLLACLHVALTGCDVQICHDKCILLLLERFEREISEARLKDMERICHVMSLFNVQTASGIELRLCKRILNELPSRIDEIVQYPKCFHACLHYLSLCGYHDEEMLNCALDQRFIRHMYGSTQLLGREVFCLDGFAQILLRTSYKGNFLLDKQRKTMGKLFTHYIPVKNSKFKLNVTDRILVEINERCLNLFGVSTIKHILPHFERPDIVIVYDTKATKGVPLSRTCSEDYSGKILEKEEIIKNVGDGIETAVIVVGGWNHFVRNTSRPTGLLQMKIKQLETLGYHTILIPWYEWREQETVLDTQNYIRRKLRGIL